MAVKAFDFMAHRFKSYGFEDLTRSMYEGLRQAYDRIISDKPDLMVILQIGHTANGKKVSLLVF